MKIQFRAKTAWALPPYQAAVDAPEAEADDAMYRQNLRWLRRPQIHAYSEERAAANRLGWIVPSPVDVVMRPVHNIEASVPEHELTYFARTTGLTTLWNRNLDTFVNEPVAWVKLYEALYPHGWEPMFCPLGPREIEWRLGWEAHFPSDCFLMIAPLPTLEGVEVAPGLLPAKSMPILNDSWGMAIAIRPTRKTRIRRGDPIARIVLVHAESLRVKGQFAESPASNEGGASADAEEPQR